MSKWYDACSGWAATSDRIQVFDFSSPYLDTEKAYFYVKKGTNFDITDLSSKKIGRRVLRTETVFETRSLQLETKPALV